MPDAKRTFFKGVCRECGLQVGPLPLYTVALRDPDQVLPPLSGWRTYAELPRGWRARWRAGREGRVVQITPRVCLSCGKIQENRKLRDGFNWPIGFSLAGQAVGIASGIIGAVWASRRKHRHPILEGFGIVYVATPIMLGVCGVILGNLLGPRKIDLAAHPLGGAPCCANPYLEDLPEYDQAKPFPCPQCGRAAMLYTKVPRE